MAQRAEAALRRRQSLEHAPTLGRTGGPPLGLSTGGLDTPLLPRGLLDHRGSEGQSAEELEEELLDDVEEDAAADDEESDDELAELVAGVADEEDERLSVR